MLVLHIDKPVKNDRSIRKITILPYIGNGEATFFCLEHGVALEDAFRYALNLSRTLGRKLGVTGDIAYFKSKYPDVKGTLELT